VTVGDEIPVAFDCEGSTLVGVLHVPQGDPTIGVVIVVGGPQYRVGSHREFVLLARDLVRRGTAVLRFDCRGMGDSDGDFPGFEFIEPDVAAAVNHLLDRFHSIRRLALWGLCDATRAICAQARRDPRVTDVVLVNPWVRTSAGHARAKLKHYYLVRIFQPEFLRKITRGEFRALRSAREFMRSIAEAVSASRSAGNDLDKTGTASTHLTESMARDLQQFNGRILLITSGRDLTAQEFEAAARASRGWGVIRRQARLSERRLDEADHTFSRRAWRDQVIRWTWEWLAAE